MRFTQLYFPSLFAQFPQALGRFDDDALAEHNQRRKKHGSQKMKLDPKLSKECEEDAKV